MPARRNNRISDADKERLIESFNKGEDFVSLGVSLGINRSTAYTIIRRYQQNGQAARLPRAGGRPLSLDRESIDFLILLIEANPCITLNELNDTLRDVFPGKPHVSNMTVSRSLQGELITLKLARNIPNNRNSPQVKTLRLEYANWMYAEGIHKHRIYIDETGFNLYTRRAYGRAPMGQRVNRIVSGQRGGNVTVITAISDQVGVLYYEVHARSVTFDTFNSFIASLEAIIHGEDIVIILDNVPCHNNVERVYPEIVFKKLPPHSPFLNPIEECFSVFKAYLKQHLNGVVNLINAPAAARAGVPQYRQRQELLEQAIHATLRMSVTRDVVSANYRHSNTYLPSCLRSEDIWN